MSCNLHKINFEGMLCILNCNTNKVNLSVKHCSYVFRFVPKDEPIDLLNVAFEQPNPKPPKNTNKESEISER